MSSSSQQSNAEKEASSTGSGAESMPIKSPSRESISSSSTSSCREELDEQIKAKTTAALGQIASTSDKLLSNLSLREPENVLLGPRYWASLSVLLGVALLSSVAGFFLSRGEGSPRSPPAVVGSVLSIGLLIFYAQWVKLCATSLDCKRKAHFDELNIVKTYKPADKDYGLMKITEPDTPWEGGGSKREENTINPAYMKALAMTEVSSSAPSTENVRIKVPPSPSGTPKPPLNPFELKRIKHYDEGKVMMAAKKMIEEEAAEEKTESTGNMQKMETDEDVTDEKEDV